MAGRVAAYPIAAEGVGYGADPAAATAAAAAAAAAANDARREERERWTVGNTNHGMPARKLKPAERDLINTITLIKSGRCPDNEFLKYEMIPEGLLNMGFKTRQQFQDLFTVLRSTGITRRHMLVLILNGEIDTDLFDALLSQLTKDIYEITTIPDDVARIRGHPVVRIRPYLRSYPRLLPKDVVLVAKKSKKGKKGK